MNSKIYEEGSARIRDSGKAFLNPLAKASRDFSVAYVAMISQKGATLLDATGATGIRGIRYALESKIVKPTILEINPDAYKALRSNLTLNKVKATAINTSIQEFANTHRGRFGFIDLDPFGGITSYIYDLMKIANDDCRLMVTATDTRVLCGADSKSCMRLYDSKPIHNELCHEGGMRTMIGYVARVAAQFGIGIEVELSVDYLHYLRAFIRLRIGSAHAYESLGKMGYLRYCNKCGNIRTEMSFIPKLEDNAKCDNCDDRMAIYGRMWMGNLKNDDVAKRLVKRLSKTDQDEALKLAESIAVELDSPFYYHIPTLTKRYRVGSISPYAVIESLNRKGYKGSPTHMERSAIRTDAPINEVIKSIKGRR